MRNENMEAVPRKVRDGFFCKKVIDKNVFYQNLIIFAGIKQY